MKKTYLVTGTAGFIGYRYAENAISKGHAVVAVDKKSHFTERHEHSALPFLEIVDREDLWDWLSKTQIKFDAVIHLGACAATTELNWQYLEKVNVNYSKKIWNYCSEKKIPLAYASSAATYGEGELGYDDAENLISKLKPLNPYGESKRVFDLWALEEEKKGHHPPAWSGFKFFNVYGFGERHKKGMASVVLHAFDQIKAKGSVKLFKSHKEGIADGHQKRDFISVTDLIAVIDFALEKPISRGIFNLGTGQARTFLDLVKATFSALKHPEKVDFIDTPIEIRERYQYFTQANMKKLRDAGYSKPFTTLEDGVRDYISRLEKNL